MRVATGSGRIIEKPLTLSPTQQGLFGLLYNFDIDDFMLKPEHQKWLLEKVVPLAAKCRLLKVYLKGTTSRSGSASYNLQLSQHRVESVQAFLESCGIQRTQIVLNWVGEGEAAGRGRIDGSENEEDRAVSLFLEGPSVTPPRFTHRHWWKILDGFDDSRETAWKMVPAFRREPLRLLGGLGWRIRSTRPDVVQFIDPDTNRVVRELVVTSNDVTVIFQGIVPGDAKILGEGLFGKREVLLDVTTMAAKTVKVAFHYVEDKAKHKTKRSAGEEKDFLKTVNRVFEPQANITFQAIHAKAMTAAEDWGNPVTYTTMGGEFLPLLGKYMVKAARINAFFVWDYEPDPKGDTDAEVDNIGGGGVIFEDNAGTDQGLSMSHEFGHNLGLPHRKTSKQLLMWPFTDDRGGLLEKDQILLVSSKV